MQLAEQSVLMMLWDIEGTDKYCGFNPRYLRGAGAYIIVIDITREQTFITANEIKKMAQQVSNAPSILLLNKTDLCASWQLTPEQEAQLKAEYIDIIETSAKSGLNVERAFTLLAQHMVEAAINDNDTL